MSKLRIGIIGGGNMGAAIIGRIRKDFSLQVCEANGRRAQNLRKKFKIKIADLKTVVESSRIVILAVKPQGFDDVLKEIGQLNIKNKLIVSIAAGITTAYIEKRLKGHVKVVRTMPNLPAQVGQGMTGLCAGKKAKTADLNIVKRIFNKIGKTVVVKEKWMDAVTAISGSGPAYFFLFVESYVEAAQSLGLKEDLSRELVLQTLKGSLNLLETQKEDAGVLRQRVTSKGGTTHAALKILMKHKFKILFKMALKSARQRAKELSR